MPTKIYMPHKPYFSLFKIVLSRVITVQKFRENKRYSLEESERCHSCTGHRGLIGPVLILPNYITKMSVRLLTDCNYCIS